MGKIADAINRYQREQKKQLPAKQNSHAVMSNGAANSAAPSAIADELATELVFDRNLVTLLSPHTYESEQFRMLKSHLLFPASGNPPRSIMVTSAVPGEGKSFTAANLAICIAQNINEHILIVDCDLRNPSIHKQFGFGVTPGLSDYLKSNVSLQSLFLKTSIKKLAILPSGKPPSNPSELLSSKKMSQLVQELTERYADRYVIIDSPPPILTSEANILAKQIDGIILTVRFRKTPQKLVSNLMEMFGKEKLLGIVLNRYDIKQTLFGYHKYGRYNRYYENHRSSH